MTCFFPLAGYYSKELNPTGKRSIVFDKRRANSGVKLQIPCGQCAGCRLARARVWAIRCMHEVRMHRASAFVTLTYEDKFLPPGGSLRKSDLQLFMKRLRHFRPQGLRFFGCGEYGDRYARPHYHVLFLNVDFPDMRRARVSGKGFQTYRSGELERLWPFGDNIIGTVNATTCSYVARYTLKKVTGASAAAHYGGRESEFVLMSRRPGLGFRWLQEFEPEAYRSDSVILGGHEAAIPRFYDDKVLVSERYARQVVGELFNRAERLKLARRLKAREFAADNTYARRVVKDHFETEKARFFVRSD